MIEQIMRDAPYGIVLEYQRRLFGERVEARHHGLPVGDDYILYVEHTPVYTLGRHADRANITHPEFLRARGAEVFEIERGGDVTFHGPGQLVVYPIIDLQARRLGVKQYVTILEESVIRTLARFGIEAGRVEGATGVWLGIGTDAERKICAIGIKCSRFISMHGLALNVTTDPGWFAAINPCGFTDKPVTTLAAELHHTQTPYSLDVLWETTRAILAEELKGLLR